MSEFLADAGGFSGGHAMVSARLYSVLLRERSGSAHSLAKNMCSPSTASTCLMKLYRLHLIERQTKGGESRVTYYLPSDPLQRFDNWASVAKREKMEKLENLHQKITNFLQTAKPVIKLEPIISSLFPGQKLSREHYSETVSRTIQMYRQAKQIIRIMTRDFDWIEDPLSVIARRMEEEPNLHVQILIYAQNLDPSIKEQLLQLRRKHGQRFQVKNLRSIEVFRLSMADDKEAYIVKKSMEGYEVEIEGSVHIKDSDFVHLMLKTFFESRWSDSRSLRG